MRASSFLQQDEVWMRRALELARRGEGRTRPNPPVGAVIVRGGMEVGAGYHRMAGAPHAEIEALRRAGVRACGATLYVTLEPCCTRGRTGPCTDAILASGLKRVVVSATDPNPRHRGRGLRLLKQAGVAATVGVCRNAGRALIAPFAKWITTGLPYVTLKMGMTLDGRIADSTGRSKWITSAASRRQARRLRNRVDAVLVGSKTARMDNPTLLASSNPFLMRVIADSRLRLSAGARVFSDGRPDRAIVATTRRAPASKRQRLRAARARVWEIAEEDGHVSLDRLLRRLGREGFLHVLCEGGGELAGALIRKRRVDRFLFFVAPAFLGGNSTPAAGGRGWPLRGMPRLRFMGVARQGNDLRIEAAPIRQRTPARG
ncbi:MAG: bifunctional diaminohydroxyphosphoribosylaminopyrimidine deaminase/5-amino-6-(5-phosphoribosylamino)uracil reductase RibD [Verrucomicrobiota bacterium]|nr:bifunctional diaminohydroxyphosphoribosylaminopyrimidine deaminase/5-amino-6-(5-phosphoribosylamino)uracil reductase RibD [Verrucomicrobiota bacterium]